MQVYNIEEFAAECDANSMEEVQKLSATLRKNETNSFNASFQEKQAKKLNKQIRVSL